uniref:Uncharacterized protein n=1 Tax=Noctiluca scintillans TaxID=2966 RepID=A0A7S1F9G9_NOCSC
MAHGLQHVSHEAEVHKMMAQSGHREAADMLAAKASAQRKIAELELEIETLRDVERRRGGIDRMRIVELERELAEARASEVRHAAERRRIAELEQELENARTNEARVRSNSGDRVRLRELEDQLTEARDVHERSVRRTASDRAKITQLESELEAEKEISKSTSSNCLASAHKVKKLEAELSDAHEASHKAWAGSMESCEESRRSVRRAVEEASLAERRVESLRCEARRAESDLEGSLKLAQAEIVTSRKELDQMHHDHRKFKDERDLLLQKTEQDHEHRLGLLRLDHASRESAAESLRAHLESRIVDWEAAAELSACVCRREELMQRELSEELADVQAHSCELHRRHGELEVRANEHFKIVTEYECCLATNQELREDREALAVARFELGEKERHDACTTVIEEQTASARPSLMVETMSRVPSVNVRSTVSWHSSVFSDLQEAVGNDGAIPKSYWVVMRQIDENGWEAMEWTKGFSLLHWAAKTNRPDFCARFMKQGANPWQVDDLGLTAIDYARRNGGDASLDVLLCVTSSPHHFS